MKHFFAVVFLILITTQCSIGQHLTKSIIDEHFDIKNDERIVYVVDGLPYEKSKLDSILELDSMNLLVDLVILDSVAKNVFCINTKAVLIVFAHQQSRKQIKKLLKQLKKTFKDNSIENPGLYIDDEKVDYILAKEEIKGLAISNIYYIYYDNELQSSRNTTTQIWTKNKVNVLKKTNH